jgi:hypothetical protein
MDKVTSAGCEKSGEIIRHFYFFHKYSVLNQQRPLMQYIYFTLKLGYKEKPSSCITWAYLIFLIKENLRIRIYYIHFQTFKGYFM